jgi:hypothetical protein
MWQASSALQVTVLEAWQAPAWQVSPRVQAFASLQPRPSATAPQMPFAAVPAPTLQARQSVMLPPPQAVSQQNPSTQ